MLWLCFARSLGILQATSEPAFRESTSGPRPARRVSSGFQGQATDIEIHAREVIELRRRLDEIIAHHSGKDVEKVRSDTERDYFMSSEEAVAYGIIDRVISEH